MSRTTRKLKTPTVLEPEDIIDLTQDSPNVAFTLPRTSIEELSLESENIEPINKRPRKRQKFFKNSSVIIHLDETINLDDSSNNTNITKQIPVLAKTENKSILSCPICLDNLSDENIKTMSTPCGHVFCLECLKAITQTKSKCSICQRPIKFSKCIRLHI
ncbi:PREDICTED: E3 ubiquitin-protein ligase RNF4-like isoform X1 [Ceratosolen solmsi marchali]|uniref:E3 ubiquitin-protein ligase RNF4-like isoform X1 n=2 Tax=Ceratosolen solmsi marchali TaxID=326594 RepID=A0AAJ7DZM3_9HYME|nr:PREDICTED: E3 ubiquitin-protein ligase RNF4-like isoform X1 [Ceratosolen solmsi marchali]XP_011502293.1 PREDICTED: E3 ubiquitin-protein ligase RNF4-like isoform X1 [Ceratosolen solmsi marchali]XP_011502294.1 PREDICTED: E3 ubiquitin-protein ligase RNF4-like isoform X1 [Ceratosolen solmsi marchali]XP_011502295.1 PREDICTED: E3 ubiquitin-protein ligase RNF4-like isoform X1 [Ceratosolen solmsi marchali]XP_011502296.1 PREDICTED: E3 ubiquitin-protein ligase RNF4-like isoform X1 [Ceratosolen solmsi 